MSSELSKTIEKLLTAGVVNRHSYFQLKYFVVGKEPTIQSKMWRCIKELQARKESLDAMEMEILEAQDNLELVDIGVERCRIVVEQPQPVETYGIGIDPTEIELNKRGAQIALRKQERQRTALQSTLKSLETKKKETEEEATFFLKAFESLQKVEQLKPFDDLEEQTKYWNEKLTQLANFKVLLHLPLDTELVQTIMALSDDCAIKTEMVKLLENERSFIEQKKLQRYQGA